jgi:hypothetical protein
MKRDLIIFTHRAKNIFQKLLQGKNLKMLHNSIDGTMPERRINISAQSATFCLTTQNGGMYVTSEGHNADAAVHTVNLAHISSNTARVKPNERVNLFFCK